MMEISLAYNQKKDRKRFLNLIDDKENMHDTWKQWHRTFTKTKIEFISKGFEVEEIVEDKVELVNYCRM